MNANEIDELMNLIYLYGAACENFGNFVCDRNAERCDEIERKIRLFLEENFQKDLTNKS